MVLSIKIVICFLLGCLAFNLTGGAAPGDHNEYFSAPHASDTNTQQEVKEGVEVLLNIRHSLDVMKIYMDDRADLFLSKKNGDKRLTSRKQREEIWQFWQGLLDRVAVLDEIGREYEYLYRNSTSDEKRDMFELSYAAFLMQYRYSLDFISTLENDPSMHTMLNEPVPELGMEEGLYKKMKFRFLNVIRATEFVRLNIVYSTYEKNDLSKLASYMKTDINALWKMGVGDGSKQTVMNALKIIEDVGFTVWFPAQKTVSEWMGDVKVLRTKYSLITDDQIQDIREILQPGDILLERREWYLSNVGLPGYWPHAALYIGTANHRKAFFEDKYVKQEYLSAGGFEAMLEQKYPEAYSISGVADKSGYLPAIIEAMSEGVSFTTLEHSVDADSVAILRPRLSKLEKSRAIERAFHFSGRPYDFNFDFLTDAELVCTELVYKAYEQEKDFKGITFPVRKVVGRPVTTANDIARMFDDEFGLVDRQLELVAFYDGHERKGVAEKSGIEVFRGSWKRPKHYIWIQDTPLDPE